MSAIADQIGAAVTAVDAVIASMHPNLAGVRFVELLSVTAISWLGARAMRGPVQRGRPRRKCRR